MFNKEGDVKNVEWLDLSDEQKTLFNQVPDIAPIGFYGWQERRDEIQEKYPKTDEWLCACHSMPPTPDIIMAMYDEVIGGFGVDVIVDAHDGVVAEYINTGDIYNATVLYDRRTQVYIVTTWGDWVDNYAESAE